MPLKYVVHLDTYLDLKSALRFEDPVQRKLNLTSVIGKLANRGI
jgi:hypothetical protein